MLNIEYKVLKLLNNKRGMSTQSIEHRLFSYNSAYVKYVLWNLKEEYFIAEISEEFCNRILSEKNTTYEMIFENYSEDLPCNYWTLTYTGRALFYEEHNNRIYKNTPIVISVLALVISAFGILKSSFG